jgi:uncharacterized protein
VRYATVARRLVDATLAPDTAGPFPFAVPGGADPVLTGHGMVLPADLSEGAYPSGLSAMATAAWRLYLLSGHAPYLDAATRTLGAIAPSAVRRPVSFGAALAATCRLTAPAAQLVVVTDDADSAVASVAAGWDGNGIVSVVTSDQARRFESAGFELFQGRVTVGGLPTAYLCRDFVCRLPLTDADALTAELGTALATELGTAR